MTAHKFFSPCSLLRYIHGIYQLVHSFRVTANSLRTLYPDRFTPSSPEFAMAISSADYPAIKWNDCLLGLNTDCIPDNIELSPILHFGSVFKDPIIPTLIGMPMPQQTHSDCYNQWTTQQTICGPYLPRSRINAKGLIFPEQLTTKAGHLVGWDDLIPQVVWRGSDFSYLAHMKSDLRRPEFDSDIANDVDLSQEGEEVRIAATEALLNKFGQFIPRWKGVVLTAEAEREVEVKKKQLLDQHEVPEGNDVLPRCNIKFASANFGNGKMVPAAQSPLMRQFEDVGIPAIGEYITLEEQGMYKYHIDIGGGGGTTWNGLLTKLGLPGMLFHHMTPTKDYIHDKLKPWVHYVPVRGDLSDLKARYEWAESHPDEAKAISHRATEFARSLGTPEGMQEMYEEFWERPFHQIVEAYQPIAESADISDMTWKEIMTPESEYVGGYTLQPVLQCGGYASDLSTCEDLVDDGRKFSVGEAPLTAAN